MSLNRKISFFFLRRKALRSRLFDPEWYLQQYPEVKSLHIDPVRHYMERGWKEGKNPSAWFDTNKYLFAYPDVRNGNRSPLKHYLRHGRKEGRLCFPVACNETKRPQPAHDTPLISVVVASYNYAHLLPEMLDSLLAQTYPHFEVVVVDDGSSDNSMEVIEQYCRRDNRIRLVTHPGHANRGLPATVRLGAESARGEFVAFCESDDKWMPSHLGKKVELLNAYEGVNIVSNHITLFGDEEAIRIRASYIRDVNNFLSEGGNRIDLFHNKEMNYIPTFSAVMIRRSVLLSLNYDTPIPAWIDFWLYRQILKDNYLYYVPEALTCWRLHHSYNGISRAGEHVRDTDWFLFRSDLLNGLGLEKRNAENLRIIRSSKLFDEDYYRARYGEFLDGFEPAVHYLFVGWKKGFDPSEQFSNDAYLAASPDVCNACMNPLLHYERFGRKDKRVVSVASAGRIGIDDADWEYVVGQRKHSKTVLLVSHELTLTGAPRALLNMAVCLKELGVTPVIVSLRDGKMREEVEALGIRLIVAPLLCFKLQHRGGTLSPFFSAFDTIVLNTLETVPLIKYFSGLKAKKLAWLNEGSFSYSYLRQYHDYFSLLPLFDKIYSVGAYSRSFAEEFVPDKEKLGILLYGIPEETKRPVGKKRDGKVRMLLPGSLEVRKGQLELMQALKLLPADVRKQLKVYLAGNTLDRKVSKAVKRNRDRCMEYLGLLDHDCLMQWLAGMDVALTPSLDDPMPIVCTEAMILGIPVIVSESTGTASFIRNGENGYTIPAGDPTALARAMEQAVAERERLPRLGEASRRIYDEHFTMGVFKEQVRRLIVEA